MLATTIQITNNPPHTTHTNNNRCWLAAQATTTTSAADAHTGLTVFAGGVVEGGIGDWDEVVTR